MKYNSAKVNSILISGANGFLGRILRTELKDHQVFTLDLADADYVCNIAQKVPELDRTFDIVIHCAGKAHMIPKTEDELIQFFNVNHQGTVNLCAALESVGFTAGSFVLISSVSVYGQEEGHNISEDTPLKGDSPYAKSKIMAESYVRSWAKKFDTNHLIFRLPLLVGENPPGNLGKMIAAIKKRRFFTIGGGKAKKSMIAASDLAACILGNLEVSGTYNLTDGEHPSFKEIDRIIAEKTDSPKSFNIPFIVAKLLAMFGDVFSFFPFNSTTLMKMTKDLTFSDELAREELAWKPSRVLDKLKELNY